MAGYTESDIEEATLAWLADLGWTVTHGPDIAHDALAAERLDYGQAVLEQRLRDSLARFNPDLPAEVLDDAFRRLAHPEGPTLETRNRAFHRMVVDGVTVEYRASDGAVRGAQAGVLDFEDPDNNDWLAVNQLTVVENKHERRPDIVLFVNGLPLGVIELKNPADEDLNDRLPGPRRRGTGSRVHTRYRVQRTVTRLCRRIYAGDVSGPRLCLNGARQ